MSFFKGFVDSVSQFLSDSSPSSAPMEAAGPSVVNERVVLKLKGYFELAKEEIDKAVRAEEWGLTDDAIAHYRNANRVMLEANEQNQVKTYQEKIAKWQGQVSERLQVLTQRTGAIQNKASPSNTINKTVSPTAYGAKKPTQKKSPSFKSSNLATGNKKDSYSGSKPIQEASGSYDTKLIEMINTTIVDRSPAVKWDDVAGLDKAKQTLLEMVILPTKRRDLFTGLRKPARGLLLFGPPGNGKTMLAKAVASESDATFFNVSASSLTSKWVGEAEKLVRTLFMVAVSRQPSVIFMDEIDSILSTRLTNENDASRRLKSEFLVQFDGVASNSNDLVIVIGLQLAINSGQINNGALCSVMSPFYGKSLDDENGATNKPQELDDAVLRRLVKRIYIPLPDESVRRLLLKNQLKGQAFSLPGGDLDRLVRETEGYSGSDLQALCEEAAMMPIRELGPQHILTVKPNQLRSLRYDDFKNAMAVIRPSLQKSRWEELEQWNKEFGSN